MSSKPVYVPPHKRKRFHGAFTGGFSAGYFNTVGTKDGWKPREDVREAQTSQDFMDDEDHNDWGGPSSVKKEFVTSREKKPISSSLPSSLDLIEPPPNVGTRLMRVLGWREGSTAYVPVEDTTRKIYNEGTLEAMALSQKRLRKIQLQQTRVKMPPPKLDSCGLGFDAYRDAPEFQAHREKRRREAQQRATAATAGSNSSNAYRMSSLKQDGDDETKSQPTVNDPDDPYLSYETMMDFVGKKTTGGFAMREDDDDVYDENPLPKSSSSLRVDKDQYDTEIYEHESDDEQTDRKEQSMGGILSSWATGDASKTTDRGITSDGRPPLPGFCLGGSTAQAEVRRYAGPELPVNYALKRHQFREDEHPAKFQQMVEHEKVEKRRHQAITRAQNPMAGGAFSALQAAMKSRFTSAAPTRVQENSSSAPTGLHRPVSVKVVEEPTVQHQEKENKEIKIERTFMLFHPDKLVCKRLGVTPPAHTKNRVLDTKKTKEASFFEQQVMKQAATAKPLAPVTKESILNHDGPVEPKETEIRPAMDVYKSIFEPKSESEAEEDEMEEAIVAIAPTAQSQTEGRHDIVAKMANSLVPVQNDIVERGEDWSEEKSSRKKSSKKRKSSERKRHRRRSPSVSSSETDLDALDSDREQYRSRRSQKKKRKRKRETSRSPSLSSSDTDLDASSSDEEERRRRRKDKKRKKHKEGKKKRKKSSRR